MRIAPACLMLAFLLAGCTAPGEPFGPAPLRESLPRLGLGPAPEFSAPVLIDGLRAGGEPVIAATATGTILVSAHPGYTHFHSDPAQIPPAGPEALVPSQGQSYMWRSTDHGATWRSVSLLPFEAPNAGPRGLGQGVGDPEFAIDARGRVWFTDLEALAEASISWSDDDGATWILGNNVASQGPIDRQWLASVGDTLYFTGNYLAGSQRVLTTRDGLAYASKTRIPCDGDFVANPANGHLYAGCADGIAVSKDASGTWNRSKAPGVGVLGPIIPEPAVDANGTIYMAGDEGAEAPLLAWTADEGTTWANATLGPFFPELANGTVRWPWTSAGSAGRVSVTFFGSPTPDAEGDTDAAWFVYNAIVVNATGAKPEVYPTKLTPTPFHRGAICLMGTTCAVQSEFSDKADRRLGDFFETTIDRDGVLHVVYADTEQKPQDGVSHVAYVRLVGGTRLVEGALPPGFPTQG